MKTLKNCASLLIFIAFIFINNSCNKEDIKDNNGVGDNFTKTTICGTVLNESNQPLTNVFVSAYGQAVVTNQSGIFIFKNINVNKSRCVLKLTKQGFFERTHAFIPSSNTVNYVRIVLINNSQTQTVSSAAGGTITLADNSSVLFPPDAFVTSTGSSYTGTVSVAFKHLSPDNPDFGLAIPGGDLLAKNSNYQEVALYSYGMLGVQLTGSNGESLQMATGTSATLTFAVSASQLSAAPATIPLWYFDESISLWQEQGIATLVGNTYVGTVAHFSWWNCDYSGPRAYLKGKVVDCNGLPLPNVTVSLNGSAEIVTDQNGEYNDWIPAGLSVVIKFQVLTNNNNSLVISSQPEIIPSLSPNQTFNVPDLVTSCPSKLTGTISGCNNVSTNAFVYVSWNGGYNYQYCMTGNFEILVPESSLLNVRIYEGSSTQTQNITSLPGGTTLNIGNTVLCNNGVQPDNSFFIDGNGHDNELIQIDTTITSADWQQSSNSFVINVSGVNHANGQSAGVYIYLSDSIAGSYISNQATPLNSLYLNVTNGEYYSSQGQNQQASIVLSQVQYIGGRVKGVFSGILDSDSSGVSNQVSIYNGKFNVARKH